MGKGKSKFLERFNQVKDNILNNKDSLDIKRNETCLSSCEIGKNILSSFFDSVNKENGSLGLISGSIKLAKTNEDFAKKFDESISYLAKSSSKESNGLIKLFGVINESKLSREEKHKQIFNELMKNKDDPQIANFIKELNGKIITSFAIDHANINKEKFDTIFQFMDCCELGDDNYPDISNITTAFESPEKGTYHKFDKEITNLIELENKKGNPDKELIDSLNKANDILVDVHDSGSFLSNMCEAQGKYAAKIFDVEYNKYKEKNNVVFVEHVTTDKPDLLVDYCKNNIIGEAKFDKDFTNTLISCVDEVVEKDYVKSGMSMIFMDDANKLADAIKNNDVDSIKKYSNELTTKMNDVDRMIAKLKALDPMHMFNENLGSSRETYYPGKYRIDYEGATLMNHVLTIANLCKEYGVSAKEILDDPIKFTKDMYKEQMYSDKSTFNNFMKDKSVDLYDKFMQLASPISEGLADAKTNDSNIDNLFIQLTPVITVNNKENRYETFHKVSSEIRTTMTTLEVNTDVIKDGLSANVENTFKDAFPKIALMGDDFNAFKHLNIDGIIDIDTKDYRKPYNIQEYLKDLSIEETLKRSSDAYKVVTARKSEGNFASFEQGLNSLFNEVKQSFVSKGIDKDVCDLIIKQAKGEELTPMQSNLAKAVTDFNMGKTENEKMDAIADLKKKYDSHNWLAKLVFPKLRKQNSQINNMMQEMIKNGTSKDKLESYIAEKTGNPIKAKETKKEEVKPEKVIEEKNVEKEKVVEEPKKEQKRVASNPNHQKEFDEYNAWKDANPDVNKLSSNERHKMFRQWQKENANPNYSLEEAKGIFKEYLHSNEDEKTIESKINLVKHELSSLDKNPKTKQIQLKGIANLLNNRLVVKEGITKHFGNISDEKLVDYFEKLGTNLDVVKKADDKAVGALESDLDIFKDMIKSEYPNMPEKEYNEKFTAVGIELQSTIAKIAKDSGNSKAFEYVSLVKSRVKDFDANRLEKAVEKMENNPEKLQEKIDVLKDTRTQLDLSFIFDEEMEGPTETRIDSNEKALEKENGIEL